MVTISGLNQKQVELCDKLWECDKPEDVEKFINGLRTKNQRCEARAMQGMMLAAIVDAEIQTVDDCQLARNLLDRFSS